MGKIPDAEIIEKTGVDGIMIGRASLGNPWIFKDIINYLEKGEENCQISNQDKLKTILRHIDMEVKQKGENVAVKELRKHIAWYTKGLQESTKIREKINIIQTQKELEDCLTEYFNSI